MRVTGERDVYVEEVRTSRWRLTRAMSRSKRFGGFATPRFRALSPEQLRAFAARYDLDYLVAERDVDSPSPIATNNPASIRFSRVPLRNDNLRIRSAPPLEGGTLDDPILSGKPVRFPRCHPHTLACSIAPGTRVLRHAIGSLDRRTIPR